MADANWKEYVQKNAPEHVYPGTGGFHDGGFLQSLEEELADNMGLAAEVKENFLASMGKIVGETVAAL